MNIFSKLKLLKHKVHQLDNLIEEKEKHIKSIDEVIKQKEELRKAFNDELKFIDAEINEKQLRLEELEKKYETEKLKLYKTTRMKNKLECQTASKKKLLKNNEQELTQHKELLLKHGAKRDSHPYSFRQHDEQFEQMLHQFVIKYDLELLTEPGVVENLLNNTPSENIELNSKLLMNFTIEHRAAELYKNVIQKFLKLLIQKGYDVEETSLIYKLKDEAEKHIYEKLMDYKFHTLLDLNPQNFIVTDVIHNYIQVLERKNTLKNQNIIFLNRFLQEQEFVVSKYEIEELKRLVEIEMDNYDLSLLEKELLYGNKPEPKSLNVTMNEIDKMSGEDFECSLMQLLKQIGFRVERTKTSGDQGIDIVARKNGKQYGIQAKRYKGSVGTKAIQEVISGKFFYDCDIAWVITNSHYTSQAKALAIKTNTLLWDREKLKNMIDISCL